jgi:hypothetical protein
MGLSAAGLLFAGGVWVAATALTVLAVGLVVTSLPPTYFRDGDEPRVLPPTLAGWARRISRNLLGLALVAVGAVLSLPGIPGQGLLTVLVGLMLLDFPGRRGVERALIARPGVLAAVNRVRRWCRKPPFEPPV